MDLFTLDKQRFANAKECILKLSGLLSSLSALVFEIVIASCQCWRLWEFDDNVVDFVSFGLWEVYFPQEFNVSGTVVKMLVHTPINSTWTFTPEFQYVQTLIMWAVLMKPVVLIFGAIAIKISCMRDPFVELQIYCYKVSAFTLCISGLFTLVSVSWNHFADHYGQTTLEFPPDFPVKKEALIEKHYTAVFPVGVLTTTMSLFGVIFFLSEIISLKLQSQVKAQRACIVADQEA
ncbi:Samt4 [Phodopus roborovskii]|uniref:Samt4 protein n=1 Tax=Phodopus roborovskii TaxID=109678 RepID=A0AAU9Z1R8_PHORO|nr:Samt4 [Phodopus roborovskii]